MVTPEGAQLGDLLLRARLGGRLDLVDLSDDEEAVVAQDGWVFTHARVQQAWTDLPVDERRSRTVSALEAMTESGRLTGWSVDDGRLVMHLSPELFLVDMARTNPSFLVYGSDDAAEVDGLVPTPRGYGLSDASGLRGVVVEIVGSGVHSYRLLPLGSFVSSIARWMWQAVTSDDFGVRLPQVGISCVHPPSDGPAVLQPFVLAGTADGQFDLTGPTETHHVTGPANIRPHLMAAMGRQA